jgi:hypothetical protein
VNPAGTLIVNRFDKIFDVTEIPDSPTTSNSSFVCSATILPPFAVIVPNEFASPPFAVNCLEPSAN